MTHFGKAAAIHLRRTSARASAWPLRVSSLWPGVALGLAVLGCSKSNPLQTGLEPNSALGTAAPSPAISDEKRYAGSYHYVGTASEKAGVEAAVDAATEGMLGMNIARHEIMKRSEIRPSYTISFDGKGNVSVESPGYPPEVSSLNGTEVQLTDKYGDVVQNSQRFVDGTLLQQGRTSDGSGSTQFKLQADGRTLRVTRVSKSPKLPRAVEFTLTYIRSP